jgi:hypothetical protein
MNREQIPDPYDPEAARRIQQDTGVSPEEAARMPLRKCMELQPPVQVTLIQPKLTATTSDIPKAFRLPEAPEKVLPLPAARQLAN